MIKNLWARVSKMWLLGELGSKEENARLDLLHLTTEYSITPEAAASMWKSFTTPTRKPISFRVCAIRPARNEFTAAVISLVGSVVGSLRCGHIRGSKKPRLLMKRLVILKM